MHSYSGETESATLQEAQSEARLIQDVGGREWPRANYHLMDINAPLFSGYFLYKISGVVGALESVEFLTGEKLITGYTWWGFHIQLANDEVYRDGFEQPLPSTEIKAWLTLNYSHLSADDYEYLTSILWLEKTPDGRTVHYIRNHYSWHQALNWLTEQRAHALVSGSAVAASVATSSASANINPWVPLLIGALKLNDFYKYLEGCGLLTSSGELTPLGQGDGLGKARKAPWVGAMRALAKAKLLDDNKAAIGRALLAPSGKVQVKLADNSLLNPSEKANTYQQAAREVLRERGYLRS